MAKATVASQTENAATEANQPEAAAPRAKRTRRSTVKLTLPPTEEVLKAAKSCIKTRTTIDLKGIMHKLNLSHGDAYIVAQFLRQQAQAAAAAHAKTAGN